MALWIEIAVILEMEIETGDMVWFGMVWHGFVGIVWYGRGSQMTSEFTHEEISIMDYNGLS